MMNRHVALLTPLVLLAACGSGQQHSVRVLNQRLEAGLSTQIAAGRAVVQRTDSGAQVTLLDPSLFPNDARSLDDQFPDVRADVIEALLDPSLMQVQVSDSSGLPAYQQGIRVRNVRDYFTANGLGIVLVPPETAAATGGPAGLNMTINVQCPSPDGRTGYGDGRSRPVCD
jgi:hypothetical protein